MISIQHFRGIPFEYESFLISRYDSYLTTCRYIEEYYPGFDIYYVLIYDGDILIDLLIYENTGNISTCLNHLNQIDQIIIDEFTKYVFKNHISVSKVIFSLSYLKYSSKKSVLYSQTNDYVLALPTTINEYSLALGNSLRKKLRNNKLKLIKEYPNVKFITKCGEQIEEVLIEDIIHLNFNRMRNKGIVVGADKSKTKSIYNFARNYGCLAYIEVDGVVIAGRLAYFINRSVYGTIIAHDDKFSRFSLGQVCQYYMIETAIERGFSDFHFLWGDNNFKQELLAKPNKLFSYYFYKHRTLNYYIAAIKCAIILDFYKFRNSKFTIPIRNFVKSYRKRKWSAK